MASIDTDPLLDTVAIKGGEYLTANRLILGSAFTNISAISVPSMFPAVSTNVRTSACIRALLSLGRYRMRWSFVKTIHLFFPVSLSQFSSLGFLSKVIVVNGYMRACLPECGRNLQLSYGPVQEKYEGFRRLRARTGSLLRFHRIGDHSRPPVPQSIPQPYTSLQLEP